MRFIKKFIAKRKIDFRNQYFQKRRLNETETLILKTVIRVAANPKNSILSSLDDKIYYIQTENKAYSVALSHHTIKIANHLLFIEQPLDGYLSKLLMGAIDKYSKKKAKSIEDEIFSNENNGLNQMLTILSR
jgi:hypothetical protein